MNTVGYLQFSEIDPSEFLPLLNCERVRKHLVEHEVFTRDGVTAWINSKIAVDNNAGCKIRGIVCEGRLVGWCGIQLEDGNHEIAIILDENYWGLGKKVFRDMMRWAKEFGHREVVMHLLNTRPDYKFLKKAAIDVTEAELLGHRFRRYRLAVT